MLKVKMLETTGFEGMDYLRGDTYEVTEETAAALGSSVEVIGKVKEKKEPETEAKAVVKPAKNKMMSPVETK
jgi:hypothetical protein